MKRVLALILALVTVLAFASCGRSGEIEKETGGAPSESTESTKSKTEINVAVMAGPTGMGAVKLMDDAANGKASADCKFTVASSPDEVTASIINGEFQIACIPTNLAAVLYNKTSGGIKCPAVNTLGVLYILTNGEEITSVADLKGKTVYATNAGSTPEFILDYVLAKNGLDPEKDVDIQFSDADTVSSQLASGTISIGMLPEPKVTATVVAGKGEVKTALDMTAEWEKVSGDTTVMQGCIIVNTEFAKNNKDTVDGFLADYKASCEYVLNDIESASALCEKYNVIPKAAVAKKAYPGCNITYIDGKEMTEKLTAFLQVLYDADAKSVGGNMPDESFYYQK